MTQGNSSYPVAAALALVWREGRSVLVRRTTVPGDCWGFPGGGIEVGEDIAAAALRELAEETGIRAEDPRVWPAFSVIRRAADGLILSHFILHPVACLWRDGEGRAASDAAEMRWVGRGDAQSLPSHPMVLPLLDRLAQEFPHVRV